MRSASCTGGSETNPITCATTHCAPGDAACCRPSKPVCSWRFTNPATEASYYTGYAPGQLICQPPEGCGQSSNFDVWLSRVSQTLQVCATNPLDYLFVRLPRPLASPGQVFTLPHARVNLSLNATDTARACTTWTGSITWNSEVPSWSVTIDATCTEAGKGHIRVTGSISGES